MHDAIFLMTHAVGQHGKADCKYQLTFNASSPLVLVTAYTSGRLLGEYWLKNGVIQERKFLED